MRLWARCGCTQTHCRQRGVSNEKQSLSIEKSNSRVSINYLKIFESKLENLHRVQHVRALHTVRTFLQ